MAADHALRRELSRRVRDDLIRLGIVQPGPAVTIADGAPASPGDLIICTRNDHAIEAGEPGRTLANGDLLRIEAVTRDGLLVRRALDADPRTGQRRWTDRHFLYAGYQDAELGYAVTDHVAQGRTVHTGLAVITGTEDRQHAYVALTRGTDRQHGLRVHRIPEARRPGPRPPPGPRTGPLRHRSVPNEPAIPPRPPRPPRRAGAGRAVRRPGPRRPAASPPPRTGSQALANADHLAILHAIWTAETTPAREQRYQDLLAAGLPPGYRASPGHQAKWLWRTLRAAELAGLDPAQVLADAIAERDLAGARDIAAVIDARLRHRLGSLVPLPPGPWSAQVPALADPERRAYARRDRRADGRPQGPHRRARRRPRPALGGQRPRPGPRATRWTGWTGSSAPPPSAPGGNYPATTTPPTRSAPNPPRPPRTCAPPGTRPSPPSAPPTAPTCAACPTGCCCTCATPTPSRPPGPRSTSATSSARSAPPPGTPAWPPCAPPPRPHAAQPARRPPTRPPGSRPWPPATRPCTTPTAQREAVFAAVMADRADWDAATRHQRHLAVAADAELRRRHPAQHYPPLRSAEPEPATQAQRDELTLTPGEQTPETAQWIKDLAAQHRTFADQLADRQSLMIPAEDPDYGDLGQAFPPWPARQERRHPAATQARDPAIPADPRARADRDADLEAAD